MGSDVIKELVLTKEELVDLQNFCNLNKLEIDDVIVSAFRQGYRIEKYGLLGKAGGTQEKRVEVPIEIIKEVEKVVIKEIIKEVPVEKIVTIYDNSSENELFGKIEQLEQNIFHLNEQIESERKIFSTKIEEMENNFQNTDNNKLQMLQKTITNLNVEIRDLKIKNKELENKLLEQPKESDFTKARFHGSSNLNDDLYK